MTRWLAGGGLLLGAAACARYEPVPLDPEAHATALQARRLADPALRTWVERHAGPVEGGWSDPQLAVAALAWRADLERTRREWLAAAAGVAAAGVRPPPGPAAGLERAVGGREEASPWVVSLTGLVAVELGGKRGARLQAARAREAAARAELALLVAATLNRVRETALAVRHAEDAQSQAGAELAALRRVEELERGRYAEAALGSGEVARTAADAAQARAALAEVEREVLLARADLAGALALPAAEVRELPLRPSEQPGCAWGDAIGADSLAGLALRRRAELARALAGYAEAEAEVRTQVAARYPDLELGPGFTWDQGVHRWTLALALPGLLGLRARAPIAAAEASRRAAAVRVAEVQDAVFAETGRAMEGCRGALRMRAVADSQRVAADRVATLARAAYDRGETGRLELARAELLQARAAAAERRAARLAERAGLALELSAAVWRDAEAVAWPDPEEQPFSPQDQP